VNIGPDGCRIYTPKEDVVVSGVFAPLSRAAAFDVGRCMSQRWLRGYEQHRAHSRRGGPRHALRPKAFQRMSASTCSGHGRMAVVRRPDPATRGAKKAMTQAKRVSDNPAFRHDGDHPRDVPSRHRHRDCGLLDEAPIVPPWSGLPATVPPAGLTRAWPQPSSDLPWGVDPVDRPT
jgi:hypothetical protein